MHHRHLDHEREQVVDERVHEAEAEEPPRQVRHALEVVVERQLRRHEDEAPRVDGVRHGAEAPRVPAQMGVVDERLDRVADDERPER